MWDGEKWRPTSAAGDGSRKRERGNVSRMEVEKGAAAALG